MGYDLEFNWVWYYLPAFERALMVTIELTILSSLIGTLLGVPVAFLLRQSPFIRIPAWAFVDVTRAIPNLVLIFFFYYFPYDAVFGIRPLSAFASALLALIVAQAAYSADVIRAAIDQVPRNQILGLRSLGFKEYQVARHIVIPSVVKQTLPVHVAFWIGNLKLTTLASVIGVEDVVFVAKVSMAQSYRAIEAWMFVALIFIVLVLPSTYGLRWLERSAWIRRQ